MSASEFFRKSSIANFSTHQNRTVLKLTRCLSANLSPYAGKTTLLDILAGRAHSNVNVSGDILVNGRNVKMSYGTVAYVPQQDLLTGTLTVRETLLFTARLRYAPCSHAHCCTSIYCCGD